jgi:hypothetical protein
MLGEYNLAYEHLSSWLCLLHYYIMSSFTTLYVEQGYEALSGDSHYNAQHYMKTILSSLQIISQMFCFVTRCPG